MKPLGSQVIAEFVNCAEDVLDDETALEDILATGIQRCGLTLISTNVHKFDPVGATVVAVIGESHVVVHTYPEARHASIDIFTCSNGSHAKNDLLRYFEQRLRPSTIRVLDVNRGNPLEVKDKDWITSSSSYGYETRYHVKQLLYSGRSKFQQIDIIENDTFGRMLFLDRDLQIAERDASVYNANLVSPLIEHGVCLDRVAILGGGDGGVLSEVLRHNPGSVVLVDIDEAVIENSKTHLRSICGDAFDRDNVSVVIADANEFLKQHHVFDAVIYDLTMYPEALTSSDRRDFIDSMFAGIADCLAPDGMITMQCCSEFDQTTQDLLTEILPQRFDDLHFEKSLVPSFCENWVFASARARELDPTSRQTESRSRDKVGL
jgi:S-adenosylmethionine decarboxylase proenzyme